MIPQSLAAPFLIGAYAFGRGVGFGHMLVGALVRGLIYALIFKVVRHLTLPETILLVVVVLVGVYFFIRGRARRRTW